ncbi:MAG: hypothetical protein ABIP48_06080 [Planctomycetota bacterium]
MVFRIKWFLCLLTIMIAVFVLCCKDKEEETVKANLPALRVDNTCSKKGAPYVTCDWYHSADIIVTGTLVSIQLIESGAVMATSGHDGEFFDKCTGSLEPALEINIAVDAVLKGITRDHLSVRLGAMQLRMFDPKPTRGDDGQIEWIRQSRNGNGKALEEGQNIGVAAYYLQDADKYSTIVEPLFGMFGPNNNTLAFQEMHGFCSDLRPVGFTGLRMEDLNTLINNCSGSPSSKSIERRNSIINNIENRPEWTFAPLCSPDVIEEDPECSSDLDCSEGEKCIQGACES